MRPDHPGAALETVHQVGQRHQVLAVMQPVQLPQILAIAADQIAEQGLHLALITCGQHQQAGNVHAWQHR
ncbi:hypothetical protein D3C76_1829420 [compost metagenome]